MASNLEKWGRIERQALSEDIEWLQAGGKMISPSGDDITTMMTKKLMARLEHVQIVLNELDNKVQKKI